MSIISGGAIFESTGFTIGLSSISAYQNVPASIMVFAMGGVPPYTFSLISGSLPTGLSLNSSTGVISGTPTGSGASSFTIHATDSNSNTLSLSATITVYVLTGTGPCSAAICVTAGSVNELATLQLIVAGYFSDGSSVNLTSLASYSCISGSGCTGSTISSSGLFTADSHTGSATVQASFNSVNGTGTVTVQGTNPVITYPTTTLPNGQQYQPYSEGVMGDPQGQGVQILATGGVAPYTCSISTGSLPTGLSLSNVAGNTNCLIGGTPTTSGAGSSFVIQVTDSASNSSTVTISSGITIVSLANIAVGLNQSTITANTTTTATALGQYTDSSTAFLSAGIGGATFVQKQSALTSNTITSLALPAMHTTTGNMLVVFQYTGQGGSSCPSYSIPTDTAGNTYAAATTQVGGPPSPPPYYNCGQMFYAYNITGNASNVTTCHTGSTAGIQCVVLEYSGIGSSDPRDQHPAPTQATPVSACTPNSVTTAQNNELGIIVCLPNSATGYTLPSGYISRDSLGLNWMVADQVYSATTTTTPVTSFSGGATSADSFIATFKSNTPTAGGVVWSSATPSCATISSQGIITGQGVQTSCTSVITATVGAVSNTATIAVTPSNNDTSIVIIPPSASQQLGSSIQFTATGNNTGQTYSATWGSTNTSIATINSSGLATCAPSPSTGGTVNISAAVSGFSSAQASLTCTQAAVIDWTNIHQVIDGFGAANPNDGGLFPVRTLTASEAAFFFGQADGQIGLSVINVMPPNGVSYGGCASGGTTCCTSVNASCVGLYASDISFATSYGARVYVMPFSPPAAYTTNGSTVCSPGNGTLAAGSFGAYATWLTNFVKSLQQFQGATVAGLTLQNEPEFCETFTSITLSGQQIHDFIKNNLGPSFVSAGLGSSLIFEPETGSYGNMVGSLGSTCATDSSCASFLGGYSFHDYDASVNITVPTANSTPYPAGWTTGKKLWQTGVSCGPGGPGFCTAGFNASMANALDWAAIIDHRLAVDNLNMWSWWWFLIPSTANVDEGLITSDTGVISQRAYMTGQYSRFIRPGYFRIDATHIPQAGVSLSAYQNTTGGNLTIVATNYTSSPVSQSINIIHAPTFSSLIPYITSPTQSLLKQAAIPISGNAFSYTLPAQSVTTFVGVQGTSGSVVNSPTCNLTDVQNTLNGLSTLSGTVTVNIPAGNCVWTSSLTYNVPSAITNLTIQGQTTVNCNDAAAGTSSYTCTATDNTVIIDSVVGAVMLNLGVGSNTFRITGITFQGGSVGSSNGKSNGFINFNGTSVALRGDHNHFNQSTYTPQAGAGLTTQNPMNGVFDHNLFTMNGQANAIRSYPETYGFTAWSQPTGWGTSNFIFAENNVFNGGFANDCDNGGRQVFRYNTIIATPNNTDSGAIQNHNTGQGVASPRLGCRTLERYHNYYSNPTPTASEYAAGDNSSGPGVAWGETMGVGYDHGLGVYTTGRLAGANNCSGGNTQPPGGGTNCPAPPNGYGYCGSVSSGVLSSWDGNNDSSGYPCFTGPGRGQGDLLSGANFPNIVNSVLGGQAWPRQMREPIYIWNQTCASCNSFVAVQTFDGVTSVADREYYVQVSTSANTSPTSPFNGTTGTGFGTLANRPTTCTAGPGGTFGVSPTGSYGVAYFATDANNNNGVLYVCTSTNTWTQIYTPYTYPHPLNH